MNNGYLELLINKFFLPQSFEVPYPKGANTITKSPLLCPVSVQPVCLSSGCTTWAVMGRQLRIERGCHTSNFFPRWNGTPVSESVSHLVSFFMCSDMQVLIIHKIISYLGHYHYETTPSACSVCFPFRQYASIIECVRADSSRALH